MFFARKYAKFSRTGKYGTLILKKLIEYGINARPKIKRVIVIGDYDGNFGSGHVIL